MPPPHPTAPGSGQGKGLVTGWDGGASATRRLWLSRNERQGGSVVEQAEGGDAEHPGDPTVVSGLALGSRGVRVAAGRAKVPTWLGSGLELSPRCLPALSGRYQGAPASSGLSVLLPGTVGLGGVGPGLAWAGGEFGKPLPGEFFGGGWKGDVSPGVVPAS